MYVLAMKKTVEYFEFISHPPLGVLAFQKKKKKDNQ